MNKLVTPLLSSLILTICVFFGIDYYSSTPNYCASCHQMSPLVKAWSTSEHANVMDCKDCHILSKPNGRLQEVFEVLKSITGHYQPGVYALPTRDTCRREECHLSLGENTLHSQKVKFDHSLHEGEKLSPSLDCTDCHYPKREKGHFDPDRNTCFSCHRKQVAPQTNPDRAPTGCAFCHGEPDKTISGQGKEIVHGRIKDVRISCKLCHAHAFLGYQKVSERTCLNCHSLTTAREIEKEEVELLHERHRKIKDKCNSCHLPLHNNFEQEVISQKKECLTCHSLSFKSARAMYKGEGVRGIKPWPDPMEESGTGCQACHMLTNLSSLKPDESFEIIKDRCVKCHQDFRYGVVLDQWKAVLESRLKLVENILKRVEAEIKKNPLFINTIDKFGEISANVTFVQEGRGIHNYGYAVYVLEVAEKGLRELLGLPTPQNKKNPTLTDGTFQYSSSSKIPPAVFNHREHQKKFPDCRECHEKYFSMHVGSTEGSGLFTMENMERGWFCGGCHNGKNSFSVKENCNRCHRKE